MAATIVTKNSSTTGAVPTSGDLVQGELAVNVTDTGLYTENASGTVVKLNAPSIDDKNTGATKYVTIASGGNVGIGASSPASQLDVSKTGDAILSLTSAGVQRYQLIARSGGRFDFYDQSAGATRWSTDQSGNLLVGTTSTFDAAAKLQIQNTGTNTLAATKAGSTSATAALGFYNPNGLVGSIVTISSSTNYNTSSDYRLKENIQLMQGALAVVQQLKPCTYTWKTDGSDGQGFIAHELAEVVPDCVTGEKDAVETYVDEDGNEQTRPVYQGIDTSFLVATLTAAIQELAKASQEQQAIITSLTTRIEALEAK